MNSTQTQYLRWKSGVNNSPPLKAMSLESVHQKTATILLLVARAGYASLYLGTEMTNTWKTDLKE